MIWFFLYYIIGVFCLNRNWYNSFGVVQLDIFIFSLILGWIIGPFVLLASGTSKIILYRKRQ